jgi:hypothetical protein
MQTKDELESWYGSPDPWGYKSNPEDHKRLKEILSILKPNSYDKALDIGCGEGFVSKHLPARLIHGIEISDTAKSRLPGNVVPVKEPNGKYDLVVCTGVIYKQYNYEAVINTILSCATQHILIGGISDWLIKGVFDSQCSLVKTTDFPYREFIQTLTLYRLNQLP